MALVKCTECGNDISDQAKTCPQCGGKNKKQKKKTSLLTWFIAIFVGIPFVMAIATSGQNHQTAKSPEEVKQDMAVQRALVGSQLLKKSMRDPESFTLEGATVISGTDSVCYEYRAKNGFGGMNVGAAVLTSDNTFKTTEMDGFEKLWKKECLNKTGQDVAAGINWVTD